MWAARLGEVRAWVVSRPSGAGERSPASSASRSACPAPARPSGRSILPSRVRRRLRHAFAMHLLGAIVKNVASHSVAKNPSIRNHFRDARRRTVRARSAPLMISGIANAAAPSEARFKTGARIQ